MFPPLKNSLHYFQTQGIGSTFLVPTKRVKITEVTLRDGLQNHSKTLSTENKIKALDLFARAGIESLEVGSFVSPKSIPNMANTGAVFKQLKKKLSIDYWALVANQKGFEEAVQAGVTHMALFTSPSESFTKKNIHCTTEESLKRFADLIRQAKKLDTKIHFRGYISCCPTCPYEGSMQVDKIADLACRLLEIGCHEVVPSDTIGEAKPEEILLFLRQMKLFGIRSSQIALHLHGTEQTIQNNVLAGLQENVLKYDAGTLGGCPLVKNVKPNLSTQKMVQFLNSQGYATGINLPELEKAHAFISNHLESLN